MGWPREFEFQELLERCMRKASKGLLEELAGLAVMDDKLVPPLPLLPSTTFFVGCRASRTGFSGCRLWITSRCLPPPLAAPIISWLPSAPHTKSRRYEKAGWRGVRE